ncbi:FAD/NAD(P)-binding domain-containing protein [Coniophora puteana RWD-64-598 SS2]|uniref:FAD/NAD(P)-binding domain-containing protein n=1 Tax=Coniophora puteana (strain RWD-64-598) TaxID=741705 RepID=A0A5M3MP94_CONPW|nr:FAD/NAD(P)-binding domain-containing protein [Coniophora puteana RWD-64-598 SS2]EIW80923.1 FAD/NAD(P)-binding domain-containing protein [Coniophora puteana RWD-64-598 SS2]
MTSSVASATPSTYDCIVIGGGHAGCSAALAAAEAGCTRVLIVEKAPEEWTGGNGYFTAGAFRSAHGGLEDLLPVVRNVTPEQVGNIDLDPYPVDQFEADIMRLAEGKSNKDLVHAVVQGSRGAIQWLASKVEVPFILSFHRQAYEIDGRQKFWGGLALAVDEGGKGLINADLRALKKAGIDLWYNCPAIRLVGNNQEIEGVVVRKDGAETVLLASGIVLAAGGYESSSAKRAEYMGEQWEFARVRGTPYNEGDGIEMARLVGARLTGDFGGCHSTCWDANAPADRGDRILSNQFTKSGYPLGVMINVQGERFVDEGEDFRNYTYAKFGRKILEQPGGVVFQVWGVDATALLRDAEYGDGIVQKITANSLEDLAEELTRIGLKEKTRFLSTLEGYNQAVRRFRTKNPDVRFDPAIKDGLSTLCDSSAAARQCPKSNWALPIDKGPFLAVKVACGITFTFGGLAIDPQTAGVISESGNVIPGLFCTGEMVGDLYHNNYPGGSGLTAGTVFGRLAGAELAKRVAAKVTP